MDLSVCVILLLVHRVCGLILLDPADLRVDDLQKALFPVEGEVEADEILTEFADLARLDAELGRPREWSAPERLATPNQGSMVTSLEPADFLWPESSPGLDETADDPEDQLEEDVENTARMLSSHHRTRRAAPGRIDAKVEVLVVVDNSIYRWFLVKSRNNATVALARIRRYFSIIFAMVDQRYQTIPDQNLNIGVKTSGILVAETRQDAAWLEYQVTWTRQHSVPGSVNANRALAKLQRWLSSQTSSLPKHDHAMAFTRYALVNKFDIELGGLAYVSSICLDDEQSISIVADSGDYQSVKVATHELGHSLGAFHDGDKNRHCPPDDNYIMAPQNSHAHNKLKNAFYFSVCSIEQMRKTLGSPKGSCVLDTPNVVFPYNLEQRPPGQRYSANLQCKMVFGKKSGLCRKKQLRKMMCSQLWCKDPENGYTCRTNSHLTALPGTDCGNGKTCHLGECRADPFPRARSGQSRRAMARAGRKGRRRRNRHQRQQQRQRQRGMRRRQPRPQQQRQQQPRQRQQQQEQQQQRQRGTRHRQPRPQQQRQQQQRQLAEPCAGDRNSEYCQGLTRLNPRACQRSAVGTYCCHTCARIRR